MSAPRRTLRIASLLPSATEIVYALGLGDELVAVTHECDYPPEAAAYPAVTRSLLAPGLPSAEIDRAVRASARDAHTIYELDADRLVALAPEVVLTQSLCEVCAVPRSDVEEAVCSMPDGARVVSLDPHTIDGVLDSIALAGDALGVPDCARQLVADLRGRIDAVRRSVAGAREQPRVLCCEWLDPIYCGGHWVPEQVRIAGGEDGLGREGEPSAAIAWDEVLRYAPEVLVLMPCGFDETEAAARLADLSARAGWSDIPAVRDGRVFAVDGSAYFSRPGPRLVDGTELLARILHPRLVGLRPVGVLRLGPHGEFEPYP
ncbi:MAG: cobalamin-binding protein [Dehalococcoidia bacterium]